MEAMYCAKPTIRKRHSKSQSFFRKRYRLHCKETESDPSNSPYVFQWTYDQHKAAMENPDILHLLIEDKDTE